ncbi:HSP90 domain-containing protein [Chaetoceros tenuissimus]|uniref:HSP90 domain-containing protein n=1 Tax=Chaetoceros tenuissimus TaxID=426638 RepID=A0AAD3CMW7_9STRA|nr:HSP90 domain-containing protein [Chaetoceros tenuissimus]
MFLRSAARAIVRKERVHALRALSSLPSSSFSSHLLMQNKPRNEAFTFNINSSQRFSSSVAGEKESLEFQAETKQLLDIVTHSLYTEKEVFLRELISNASDALEKLRHMQTVAQDSECADSEIPLEIRIETDEVNGTISISDTGIGMNRQEMIDHLGTIARSGSKAFMNDLAQKASEGEGADASRGIIGKFGVGFYSVFMVGDKVEVRSKPAFNKDNADPLVWSSSGVGSYEISTLPEDVGQSRGATLVIHLKEDQLQFADEKRVEEVLKKYSNFVNFPIFLNGNRLNTVNAIWADDPKTVTDEQYSEFYKYIAHAFDEPMEKLHYRADAPLDIKALFFVPSFHQEKYGMGRMEPSVSLYSRKVLIEAKSPNILPDWLRFIKGVVDSEDLPLSVSREKAQDSALIAKLKKALTRKFINHLSTMARKNPDKYKGEFYKEYGFFLKEGVCQDYEFQEPLSKLLYYETSKTKNGEISSLDEYVSRCTPEQKDIYYICAPSRELALQSPYLEAFQRAGREVIFVYSAIDDFVMANLEKFQGRKIISVEKGGIDLGDDNDEGQNNGKVKLSQKEADEFCAWFQVTLKDKVSSCRVTNRLASSPAVVTDNESGAMRRMMQLVETQEGPAGAMALPKQQVEINPKHPIIAGLFNMKEKEPDRAKVVAEQIFDNCLIAAGLLDDGRSMLGRLNDIMLYVVKDTK